MSNALATSGRLLITFITAFAMAQDLSADQAVANWMGSFMPCERHSELLKYDSMDLGVRFACSNPAIVREFRHALQFWSKVLNMTWHDDRSSSCSVQLVDGTPIILHDGMVARAQFAEAPNFQGWIAFDARAPLTRTEMYRISVHEIGHLMGLRHNSNPRSVMYYEELDADEVLDSEDLRSLAALHKLRHGFDDDPTRVGTIGFWYELTHVPNVSWWRRTPPDIGAFAPSVMVRHFASLFAIRFSFL